MHLVARLTVLAMAIPALGLILSEPINAYTATGAVWNQSPVAFYINTTNLDLPTAAIEPAVRAGADVWATQSRAAIAFAYAGSSTQTTTDFDGVNLVVFRNASNGSAIATTYYWSSGSRIIDADIVFWDAAFQFFSGTTGCSDGFYIEDIAAHEFGHAIGMGHSSILGATMYPSVSSCNMGNRTLDADDIAGVEVLYPPIAPRPVMNLRIVGD
jgi:hypothetical protein